MKYSTPPGVNVGEMVAYFGQINPELKVPEPAAKIGEVYWYTKQFLGSLAKIYCSMTHVTLDDLQETEFN